MNIPMRLLLVFLLLLTGVPSLPAAGEPPPRTADPPPAAAASPLEQRFREGLYAEEAKQDFDTATRAYQEIVASFDRDRETAASALFRLGEVHRKQSRPDAARDCFRRVAREFPDREPLARLARENLRALGETPPEVPGAATSALPGTDPEQEKVIARLVELEKNSPGIILHPDTGLKTNGCISFDEAVAAGYTRVVEWLLDHGASPDKTPSGASPMVLAATLGHPGVIELLLKKGAKLENPESNARPLTVAAMKGHLMVVRLLVEKGAKVDGGKETTGRENPWLGFALPAAVKGGHQSVVEYLLSKGADPNIGHGSPILTAASENKAHLVKILLEAKADPKVSNGYALMHAIRNANTLMVKIFLEAGIDPDQPRVSFTKRQGTGSVVSLTPGSARENGNRNSRNFIEGWGTVIANLPEAYRGYGQWKPSGPSNEECGALHLACLQGAGEIVSILLARGMEVDAKTQLGSTALELACLTGEREVAALLLKAGASVDHPTPGGLRLVDLILTRRDLAFYELLRSHGAKVSGKSPCGASALSFIGMDGNTVVGDKDLLPWYQRLLDDGADPDGDETYKPVNHAAYLNNLEMIRLLKAKGADFTPEKADAPLSLAVSYEFTEKQIPVIKALVEAGADLNAESTCPYSSLPVSSYGRSPATSPLLETVAGIRPPLPLLEEILALHPDPGLSFQAALGKNRSPGQSQTSGPLPAPAGPEETPEKARENTLLIMRRLWDYGTRERNPQLGKYVWLELYDPEEQDTDAENFAFKKAAAGTGPVDVITALSEALRNVRPKPGMPRNSNPKNLPDLTRLTILRIDPASGRIKEKEPLDLKALMEKGGDPVLPVLQPGDILSAGALTGQVWPEYLLKGAPRRHVTVKAGDWTRRFRVYPWRAGFRWDPSLNVLAVDQTVASVMRYLPRPAFCYRLNATRYQAKGKPPVVLDLTKPGEGDLLLTDDDEISVEQIPDDDPALVTRMSQGLFVSREADGFLREVYHNPARPDPGMEWQNGLDREVIIRFCASSECVLPCMDLKARRVVAAPGGGLWGSRLEIPLLKDQDENSWLYPRDWDHPERSLMEGPGVNITFQKRDTPEKAAYVFSRPQMRFEFPGEYWTVEWMNSGNVGRDRSLSELIRLVTLPSYLMSQRLLVRSNGMGGPPPPLQVDIALWEPGGGWESWTLEREGQPPLTFTPGKDPLPFVFMKEGDALTVSAADLARVNVSLQNSSPQPGRARRRVNLSPSQ